MGIENLPSNSPTNEFSTPWDSLSDLDMSLTDSDKKELEEISSKLSADQKLISHDYKSMPPLEKERETRYDGDMEIVEASPSNRIGDRLATYNYDGRFMLKNEWVDTMRQEGKSVKANDLPLDQINAPK